MITREILKKAFVDEAEETTNGNVKLSSLFILGRILEIIDEVFDAAEMKVSKVWVLELIRDRDCKSQGEIDVMNEAIKLMRGEE